MRQELNERLFKAYPTLLPPNRSLMESLMAFGCECGDGWYPIIDKLFSNLSMDPSLEVIQVKEKFGGLRVYLNSYTDEADRLIAEAELQALATCEVCGEEGTLGSTGYWLSTRCPKCAPPNWTPVKEEE